MYTGYGIGFDSRSKFFLPGSSMGKNVIIIGVDRSSFVNIDNKKKDILIFHCGLGQLLNDSTFIAETKCSIDFSRSNRKFCFKTEL